MHPTHHIPDLVVRLYEIVRELEQRFSSKHFALDGHLAGSLGEVLGEYRYALDPLTTGTEQHDARTSSGKLVQIKATRGKELVFVVVLITF